MNRRLLAAVAVACCLGTGCRYLENRGRDFLDSFKISADAGLGVEAHVRAGPAAVGAGFWVGYGAGIETKGRPATWVEGSAGLPFSMLLVPLALDFQHGLGGGEPDVPPLLGLLASHAEIVNGANPSRPSKGTSRAAFWFWMIEDEDDDERTWGDLFWIEASARCLVGLKAGFNVAEFADFLLGWFGLDIASDDRPLIDAPEELHGESVPSLAEELASPNPSVRRESARWLWRAAPLPESVLPAVVEALADAETRKGAGKALVRTGAAACPFLLKARDTTARVHAACVLGRIGAPALPGLVDALARGGDEARLAAAGLAAMGSLALPLLLRASEHADPPVRLEAAKGLERWRGRAPRSADDLARLLASSFPEARRGAAWALGAIGPGALEALSALTLVIENRDESQDLRTAAIRAVGSIGPEAGPAVPALVACLEDPSAPVRRAAIQSLGEIGAAAAPAVPALLSILRQPERKDDRFRPDSRWDREMAYRALWEMGQAVRPFAPDLGGLLDTADSRLNTMVVRLVASSCREARASLDLYSVSTCWSQVNFLEAIRRIGPEFAESFPARIRSMHSDPLHEILPVRGRLDPVSALPSLLRILEKCSGLAETAGPDSPWDALSPSLREGILVDPNEENRLSRFAAVSALQGMGEGAAPAIPLLVRNLGDPDPLFRERLVALLASLGGPAVGPLTEALSSPSAEVRGGAARTLEELGPKASSAAAALGALLSDADPVVRVCAAGAIRAVEGGGERWAPVVEAGARGANARARLEAIRILGESGGARPAWAVPLLLEAAGSDPRTAEAAFRALGALGASALPALLSRLEERDSAWRPLAARAIGAVGPEAAKAVALLAGALEDRSDEDGALRFEAAGALGGIGRAAADAVPALERCLEDEEPGVRVRAARALRRIRGPNPALEETILDALLDEDSRARAAAMEAVEEDEDLAVRGIPALARNLFRAGRPAAVLESLNVFVSGGIDLEAAKRATAVDAERRALRVRAAGVLGALGARAKNAVPALESALFEAFDWPTKEAIVEALVRIGE
jgi:HEAT repeat protein